MRIHFGTLLLSVAIAMVLWGMAQGTSSVDRGVDIPIVFDEVPDDLVIVGQTVDTVNLRVLGSRAALRNVSSERLEYRVDVAGAKPGHAVYEVDSSLIELPRGVRAVSRSPAAIEAADIALLADDLTKVPYAVRLARRARATIRLNIGIALGLKTLLAVGALLGVVSLAMAVLIGDMGGSIAVTLNALRVAATSAPVDRHLSRRAAVSQSTPIQPA